MLKKLLVVVAALVISDSSARNVFAYWQETQAYCIPVVSREEVKSELTVILKSSLQRKSFTQVRIKMKSLFRSTTADMAIEVENGLKKGLPFFRGEGFVNGETVNLTSAVRSCNAEIQISGVIYALDARNEPVTKVLNSTIAIDGIYRLKATW